MKVPKACRRRSVPSSRAEIQVGRTGAPVTERAECRLSLNLGGNTDKKVRPKHIISMLRAFILRFQGDKRLRCASLLADIGRQLSPARDMKHEAR